MRPDVKKLSAFSVLALATILSGSINSSNDQCSPQQPAACYPDDCNRCYCLGPENIIANAPVVPLTCDGDFALTVALLYWQANEDGLEYAINNQVLVNDGVVANENLTNLIDSSYKKPDTSFDFGFKLGASYASACDGWDVGLLWTYFKNTTDTHVEAEESDNHTLIPLWSAWQFPSAGNAPNLFATDIETFWKLNLNLVDIELGRKFWVSHYLSLRPHIGLRYGRLNQHYNIQYKGGSWNDPGISPEANLNDLVKLRNKYEGVGPRAGFDTQWGLGCGWALYGGAAVSIIYGRFDNTHDEMIREAIAPFNKTLILESKDHLRASRAALDLGLGIQWSALVCDCKYEVAFALGYEQHTFFHQNQLWRVKRLGGNNSGQLLNSSGENEYDQRRGNLSTEGITLTGKFSF